MGSTIDEFLNFNCTAEAQAEAAGRALGALITKTIKNGGLPYKIFSMLYDCGVCSVSDYGSEVWGFQAKDSVSKIHLRAARCFLGLPKSATSAGVLTEMNWTEPVYRSQINMIRQFFRIKKMDDSRLTKQIFNWDKSFSEMQNLPTWSSEVKSILSDHNLIQYFEGNGPINGQSVITKLKESMSVHQNVKLKAMCLAKPKLRTFVTFKEFGTTPSYILMPMSFILRKYLALARLSNLAIRMETGRFERPPIPENFRFCPTCKENLIENESHLIFQCETYHTLRQNWLSKVVLPQNFQDLEASQKLKIVLNDSKNVKVTAQFILDAYNVRSKLVNRN